MKIIAAKININENIFAENYKDLIPLIGQAIINNNKKEYQYRNSGWTFGDISEIEINEKTLIKGKLFKLFKKKYEKEWDNQNRQPKKCDIKFAYESVFLFDPKSEYIIFSETSNLKRESFLKFFPKLCTYIDCRLGSLKLELCLNHSEVELNEDDQDLQIKV